MPTNTLAANSAYSRLPAARRFGDGLRALVVEDNEIDQYLLQRMLLDAGFTVELASSTEDALELAASSRPDLVCCDVRLPGADGYVLCSAIRGRYPQAYIPFIFITALSDEQHVLKCFEVGADDVVIKPVMPARLRAKVAAALRTGDLHRELERQRDQLADFRTNMQRDMEIAKTIIDNLGSEKTLALPNVSYHLQPMDTLNGDLIIGGRSPGGAQCFLFGDFTGHGLPAAIGVQVVHGVFCAMVARGHAIERIAAELNRKVRQLLPRDRFLSAALIEIYADSGTISVWNGGMPELLVCNKDGRLEKGFRSTKLPLGVLPNDEFDATATRRQLRQGDSLLCYSDGVIEALDSAGQMFGIERVKLALTAAGPRAVETLCTALRQHTGDTPQQDDISMLQVRFDPDAMRARLDSHAPLDMSRAATHWQCSVALGHDALRGTDPIPVVGALMDAIQGFGPRNDEIHMVVSTLFARALEQGLLGLDANLKCDQSGFANYYHQLEEELARLSGGGIEIGFAHTPDSAGGVLEITVSMSGGQSPALAPTPGDKHPDLDAVAELCESLEFDADGRRAVARYRWYKAA
ncbi:MAG: fused response regulator/phosphatase [Proteobacteria bacterium]|nr:fused response regulator/phosphatase [Pseudomonadota bacterium]